MYNGLTEYYDDLFPLKKTRLDFLRKYLKATASRILDVGCATGELALELAGKGYRVTGVDLDEKMIDAAKKKAQKAGLSTEFYAKDMAHLDFFSSTFDVILCLGNTLPHLGNIEEVYSFLQRANNMLSKGGILVLQAVNFDRMLRYKISKLPLLETSNLLFHRNYHYIKSGRLISKIRFETRLSDKEGGVIYEGSETLLPLKSRQVKKAMAETGFYKGEFYGDENGNLYNSGTSKALIVAARKMNPEIFKHLIRF
jgi:glycine/sarcosine N-methyltransferase